MSEKIEYKGEKHSLYEWSKITGISYKALCNRYTNGDTGEALFRKNNILTCKICGKEFEAGCCNAKCCSEKCKKENAKINSKRHAERVKLQQKEEKEKKKKKLTIAEIAVIARKAGMTYGQYVAQMEGRV